MCGLSAIILLVCIALMAGCQDDADARTSDGRIILDYWEHWSNFEADAMQAVVDDYNASQDRVFVRMLSVGDMGQKLMLATSGGNPPDVAGLWTHNLNVYAEKGALTPLNKYLAAADITQEQYIPVVWELCQHRGFTWALPTTPATLALHYNRQLFRDAGLDPDQPPRTIAELDRMAEQLTIVELNRGGQLQQVRFTELTPAEREAKDFKIIQLGHTPAEPGWWKATWGFWWGGSYWDGEGKISADSEPVIASVNWHGSYARKYGEKNLLAFSGSFGNFDSPQNPFLSGKIAMVLQGVWMSSFVDRHVPDLDWAAAPFPSVDAEQLPKVTIVEMDILVIPKGAKHPDEAFAFMRYVNTREAMEKLCRAHGKFSPLTDVSPGFMENHPNPQISVFHDLAYSPNARYLPRIAIWNEYVDDLIVATDKVYRDNVDASALYADVQQRAQWKLDRVLRRWEKVGEQRKARWAEQ